MRGTGCTGYEVAAALRDTFDIHVELATHATMVLILGLGQPPDGPRALRARLRRGRASGSRPGEADALVRAPGALDNEVVVPPREAFLGEAEVVAVDDAVGRVSAESIAGYPPGIPALLPGSGSRGAGRLPARAQGRRRAPARRERPDFRTINVLLAHFQQLMQSLSPVGSCRVRQ